MVIAYKYRLDVHDGSGYYNESNFFSIVEYYIPSVNLCFNKYISIKTDGPRNIPSQRFFKLRAEPLTQVYLPDDLISQITKDAEQSYPQSSKMMFIKYNINKSLFKIESYKKRINENYTVEHGKNFCDRYQRKGNNVFKKAVIQYILDGTLPKEITLNDLTIMLKNLDTLEIESVIKSIKHTLSMRDGSLNTLKTKAITNIEKSYNYSEIFFSGVLGGIAGNALFPYSSLINSGIGFFVGSGVKYARGKYKNYTEIKLWDQREKRSKFIVAELENIQKQALPTLN